MPAASLVLYAEFALETAAASAFDGLEMPVLATSGSYAASRRTSILFVSVGRASGAFKGAEEESDLVLSCVLIVDAGWFTG